MASNGVFFPPRWNRTLRRSGSKGVTSDTSVIGPVVSPLAPLPNSEEQLERRVQHRERGIEKMKASDVYCGWTGNHDDRPVTPDPRRQPEKVSKRAWDRIVREWRRDLKAGSAHEPMYIEIDWRAPPFGFASVAVPKKNAGPLRVEWSRERPRSRSPCGATQGSGEGEEEEEVSEATWARRLRKRTGGVEAIKRSEDYLQVTADPSHPRPKTPDPHDRKVSKRSWERSVQVWRFDLKAVAAKLRERQACRAAELLELPPVAELQSHQEEWMQPFSPWMRSSPPLHVVDEEEEEGEVPGLM